jgi:hypothetical protein
VDSTELATYGLLGTGLAIGFVSGLMAMARRINQEPANAALLRLVKAGELERVVKLCRAAPRTFFAAVSAGTVAAIEARTDDSLRVLIAAQDAFDAAGKQLAARWRSDESRPARGPVERAGLRSRCRRASSLVADARDDGGIALLALTSSGDGRMRAPARDARRDVAEIVTRRSRSETEPTTPASRPRLSCRREPAPRSSLRCSSRQLRAGEFLSNVPELRAAAEAR